MLVPVLSAAPIRRITTESTSLHQYFRQINVRVQATPHRRGLCGRLRYIAVQWQQTA
jgi:hypothetical protein